MAAPIESSSDSSEETGDATDPLSDSFDPYRALYSPKVRLPIPDAKQFNNLAEFENFLNNKDSKSQKQKKKTQLPGIIAQRAAMQAKEAARKAAITSKNAGPAVKSHTQQRKHRSTSVFTNMEKFEKGPLSILRRCAQDRLRVVVVVRAAVSVRSHCRGYIIAFDKHMNMALMDVDEKFIRPMVLKPHENRKAKVDSDSREKEAQTSRRPSLNRTERISSTTSKTSDSEETDLRQKLKQLSTSRQKKLHGSEDHALSDSDILKHRHLKNVMKTRKSQSDNETEHKQIGISGDGDCRTGSKKKKTYTPFWPLYKKWTENRCYASYEIVDRHINQLFIRGDNVVSVSIAS